MSGRTLAATLAVLAATVGTATASALSRPQVISVLDVEGQVVTDPPNLFGRPLPPPVGSRAIFSDTLYAWAGTRRGARIGRLEALCTFTGSSRSAVRAFCTATAFLPAGQIVIAGSPRFSNAPTNFAVAVVGGTGRYSNARGWGRIRDIGQTGNSSIVFHLTP